MRTLNSITLLALLLLSFSAFSGKDEFTKKWSKTFEVNSDAQLELKNKFGKLHITTWDQNQISVEVVMTTEARDQDDAEKQFKKVEIKSSGSKEMVSIETQITNKQGNLNMTVDYEVKMPRSNALTASNAFGDIFLNELDGKAEIKVEYGALQILKLNHSENEIEAKFSKCEIEYIKGGQVEIAYSPTQVERGEMLEIKSSFSELEIDRFRKLIIDSQYDHVEIEEVDDLKFEGQFSSFEIERINKKLEAESAYGNIEVDEVSATFEDISVENKFGNTEIEISDEASYLLSLRSQFGNIDFPKNLKVTTDKKDGTDHHVEGVMGESPGNRSVNITTQQGNIELE